MSMILVPAPSPPPSPAAAAGTTTTITPRSTSLTLTTCHNPKLDLLPSIQQEEACLDYTQQTKNSHLDRIQKEVDDAMSAP
jgi:hypothetical protein